MSWILDSIKQIPDVTEIEEMGDFTKFKYKGKVFQAETFIQKDPLSEDDRFMSPEREIQNITGRPSKWRYASIWTEAELLDFINK